MARSPVGARADHIPHGWNKDTFVTRSGNGFVPKPSSEPRRGSELTVSPPSSL